MRKEASPLSVSSPHTFAQLLAKNDSQSAFLQRDADVTASCRDVLSNAFENQSSTKTALSAPLGPLSKLHVSKHFAHDQLWQQLELRNKQLLIFLNEQVIAAPAKSQPVKPKRRVSFALPPSSSVAQPEDEPETQPQPKQKASKRKLSEVVSGIDAHDASGPSSNSAEDGFFNIADMEAFANNAETLAEQGKLISSDEDSEKESNPSEHDSENENDQLYTDFFDPPQQKSLNPKAAAANRAAALLDEVDASDASEGDSDGDDEKEEPGHADDRGSKSDDGNGDGNGDKGREEKETPKPSTDLRTPLEDARNVAKNTISAIEDASVQARPWALRGEVSAFARPKDSLLQTDMQHDISARPASQVDTDISKAIEDLIKQRIVDGLFDDITLSLPENYNTSNDKRKLAKDQMPEVSQERPTEGLAEVYAREYSAEKTDAEKRATASDTVQREVEVESEEQREVNKLFEKLGSKLDSLSRLRFTPNTDGLKPEVLVNRNVKSIMAEETVPEGISDGDMLAPHEVFAVGKGSAKGEAELTKMERKAKRRANKMRNKKSEKEQNAEARSTEHFDSVEVDKRRGKEAIQRRRKKARTAPVANLAASTVSSLLGPRAMKASDTAVEIGDKGNKQAASQLVL